MTSQRYCINACCRPLVWKYWYHLDILPWICDVIMTSSRRRAHVQSSLYQNWSVYFLYSRFASGNLALRWINECEVSLQWTACSNFVRIMKTCRYYFIETPLGVFLELMLLFPWGVSIQYLTCSLTLEGEEIIGQSNRWTRPLADCSLFSLRRPRSLSFDRGGTLKTNWLSVNRILLRAYVHQTGINIMDENVNEIERVRIPINVWNKWQWHKALSLR